MKRLDELEAIAKAATPGPWGRREEHNGPIGYEPSSGYGTGPVHFERPNDLHRGEITADAEHIAAFNPDTALKLIEALRVCIEEYGNEAGPFDGSPLHERLEEILK